MAAAAETVRSLGNVRQWEASGKQWEILGPNGWRVAVARLGLEAEAGFPWDRDSQQYDDRDLGAGWRLGISVL